MKENLDVFDFALDKNDIIDLAYTCVLTSSCTKTP